MASADEGQPLQTDENEVLVHDIDTSSESDDSGDDHDEVSTPVEWLATGRERRSTAGNRLKSMIAAEEPDDELELLFAEDDDDAGFTDVGDDGSDVHMDSSSDDEDAQENGDDLEGEKELEKKAREGRQAARKRKAQEAIPLKFRKKVKIDTTRTGSSTPTAPQPRPKKKSERTSWLPSATDMPTRASKRETTMMGKEQLHKQMIEREVKRLKQVEAMERKAKRMEALKKPPMTQAQHLAEAALVEKKNAKSLNRWEEAEKQREEERKAKLAALNNRTLEGPVVTFWSGVGEWIDGKLKHVGKIVTIEEKPAKKKRASAAGHEGPTEPSAKEKATQDETTEASNKEKVGDGEPAPTSIQEKEAKTTEAKADESKDASTSTPQAPKSGEGEKSTPATESIIEQPQPVQPSPADKPLGTSESTLQDTESSSTPRKPSLSGTQAQQEPGSMQNKPEAQEPGPAESKPEAKEHISPEHKPEAQEPKPTESKPQDIRPPDMTPPSTSLYTTSMFAPPQQLQIMKPPELKPPSNSFLAPPAGVHQSGLSMPMIGYHSTPHTSNTSNVLAPPNTAQRQSPLSMPQTHAHAHTTPLPTPPRPAASATPSTPTPTPKPKPKPKPTPTPKQTPAQKTPTSTVRPSPKHSSGTLKPTKANAQKQPKEVAPPPPPSPPANGKATRNCIILQNFNENAVKEKPVQNRILFGQEMAKLGKQAPAPRCVITNHPARYRDPKTGLPYYNAYAYQEIQKLQRGEYKWSRLVGAWLGSGSQAAKGVPARFLDPDAPAPPKKAEPAEEPKEDAPKPTAPETGEVATAASPSQNAEVKEVPKQSDVETNKTTSTVVFEQNTQSADSSRDIAEPSKITSPVLPTEQSTQASATAGFPSASTTAPEATLGQSTLTGPPSESTTAIGSTASTATLGEPSSFLSTAALVPVPDIEMVDAVEQNAVVPAPPVAAGKTTRE